MRKAVAISPDDDRRFACLVKAMATRMSDRHAHGLRCPTWRGASITHAIASPIPCMAHARSFTVDRRLCSGISTKSPCMLPEEPTWCCCSTGLDGTPPAISSGRRASRRSCCRPARPSSNRSSRSGNFCAPTTSPTASSRTTTPPLTPPATHGENSLPSRSRLHQSGCIPGRITVNCEGR